MQSGVFCVDIRSVMAFMYCQWIVLHLYALSSVTGMGIEGCAGDIS